MKKGKLTTEIFVHSFQLVFRVRDNYQMIKELKMNFLMK